MSGPDWFRWYPSKWLSGTLGLTNEQRGVYVQVVNVILDRGSCPDDEDYLMRLCNLHRRPLRRIINELIDAGKLTKNGGNFEQTRAKLERKEAETFVENQRNRALKRWKNKGIADAIVTDANHNHNHNHSSKKDSDGPSVHLSRGSRLPPDWEPSADQCGYAKRLGLDPERAAADFRDYWCSVPGQRGIKLDWNRTWQTRCRELADRMARDRMRANGNGRHQQPQQKNWYGRRIMQRIAAEEQTAHGADPLGLEDPKQGRR